MDKSFRRWGGVLVLMVVWGAAIGSAAWSTPPTPAERRAELIRAAAQGAEAVPAMAAALNDANLVVRRTAVRLLTESGPEARPALASALANSDALVRRAAISALCTPPGEGTLGYLRTAVADTDASVRWTAVNLLVGLERTPEVEALLMAAQQDAAAAVREVAARAMWPFYRETTSVRDRKDWDHEIKVAQTIPLPEDGWKLQFDPMANGHLAKWYDPTFDDSAWMPIAIGKAWEEQGHDYDGIAWYRGRFDLPAAPANLAVELAFGAVDEVAWVWVNGQYVGQHDIGTAGWDQPFTLDVTREVLWGQSNQITVRVHDSAQAGGIWRPVSIQVLQ